MSDGDGILAGIRSNRSTDGPHETWRPPEGEPQSEEELRLSEERLRLAQAAAGMGSWDWRIETGEVRWSAELVNLHGLEPHEFDGTFDGFIATVIPEDRPVIRAAIEAARESGEIQVEYRVRHRDGSVHWISAHGRVLFNDVHEPYRMIGVGIEITEQKATQASLVASEERFRSIANAVPVFIWIADWAGARTWFNRSWHEFTGTTLEQDYGDGWRNLVHPEDRERYFTAYANAIRNQQPFEVEYRLRGKDGSYSWMLARARPFELEESGSGGFVGLSVDITPRKRVEQQLRILSDAGATLPTSLDYPETPARLAEIAVPLFADWCVILVREPDGSIRRVAVAHRDPEQLPLLQRLADFEPRHVNDDHFVAEVLRERRTTLVREIEWPRLGNMRLDQEFVGLLQDLRLNSVIALPLLARGRTIGALLAVRTTDSEPYNEQDLAIGEELARRAALAMDNARLYAEQQRANEALQLLADAGAQLAASLDFDETLSNLARLVVPRFADWCAVDVLEPDGTVRHVVVAHRDPEKVEFAREVQARFAGRELIEQIGRLRDGSPVFLPQVTEEVLRQTARNEEDLEALRKFGIRSLIAVPLWGQNQILGSIGFVISDGERQYDETDLAVAQQLGRRAGLFVANSRLYLEAQRIESQLLRANESLRLIADVGARMGSSLEYDEAITSLARLPIPAFADYCWVDVVEDDGTVRRAAIETRDPEQRPVAQAVQAAAFEGGRTPGQIANLLRRGQSRLIEEVTEQTLQTMADSAAHLQALQRLGPRSMMQVPLKARGRVLGVLTFVLVREDRRYTRADLALAEDIAQRAALFVDNARLYTEMQRKEAELRRANEAKDEFLSMMSHELRTPLTVINGGARILRTRSEQLDEPTRSSIIADIEQESERLFRMVENLLAMAHIEFSEDVSVEPVMAQRLLDRVVEWFQQRRPDRPVELRVEPGLHALAAEPTYLEQVVRNLLSNADKYSPEGQPIEVRAAPEGTGAVAIRVLDRGIGVEPHELERIFERFYRSERTARLVGGSGVGLALCKRLVEAMSGHMWARNRKHGGLEVGFILPTYEETK